MVTFVIGGARSGKSRFALSLAAAARRVAFIATARAEDEEMRLRIARHRQERPSSWTTVEEPLAIADAVARQGSTAEAILLDCLTLWLGNFCWTHRNDPPERLEEAACVEVDRLLAAAAAVHLVVVANEVGCGIVSENSLGRKFRDLQGVVNQRMARGSDAVYQVVAGIPVLIKRRRKQGTR